MKRVVAVMLVLGLVSVASATSILQLGDATAPFASSNASVTVTPGSDYVLYIWGSSDRALQYDEFGSVIPDSGLDNLQVYVKLDSSKVDLKAGNIGYFAALSNPFGTSIAGKDYGSLDASPSPSKEIIGGLLNTNGVDAFPLTKIFRLTLTVASTGTTVFMGNSQYNSNYVTKMGNTQAVPEYNEFSSGSVTFVPEPATLGLMLLGLGLLRRKH